MPDTLSIVNSKPLPELSIVSSQPLSADQPGFLSRAASFVGDTLSKTAHKMNIENTLDAIENIGDSIRAGDWKAAGHSLVQFLPDPEATYEKVKAGDYSGAASDVLPYVLGAGAAWEGGGGGIPKQPLTEAATASGDAVKNAAATAGTALKGAAQGVAEANKRGFNNPAHGAAIAAAQVPVVGHPLAAIIEATNTAVGAVKGARNALAERATQNASEAAAADLDARLAAQRANPRISLPQQAGVQTSNPEPPALVEPIPPAYPTNRATAPAPRPPAPATRVSLPQQAGVQATPQSVPEGPNLTDADLAQIRSDWVEKMQARKAARTPATNGNAAPTQTSEDVSLLDDIARAQAQKPFAKLTASQQAGVRTLAARILNPQPADTGYLKPNGATPQPSAQPAAPEENPIPEAYRSMTESGLGVPEAIQARANLAARLARKFFAQGIRSDQLDALDQRSPAARKSFWDTAAQSVSTQKNYSPSAQTIDAVKDALAALETNRRSRVSQ